MALGDGKPVLQVVFDLSYTMLLNWGMTTRYCPIQVRVDISDER